MSVSAPTTMGSGDLLIVADPTAFAARVAELKASRESAEKAFKDLRLGLDAAKAWEKASEQQAKYEALMAGANVDRERLMDEARAAKKQLEDEAHALLAEAKAEAKRLRDEAHDEAKRARDEAKADAKAAKDAVKAARKAREDADAAAAQAVTEVEHAVVATSNANAERERLSGLVMAIKALVEKA
jgi:multidrug resistance efflux pump